MGRVTVDAIIPVYGNWPLVKSCIQSLLEQTRVPNIIVIDDCSPDDTADRISNYFPQVQLIRNESNRGFASTCNRGFRESRAEVAILINSDVVANSEMIELLSNAFERHENVGSATPLIFKPNGRIDGFGITADVTLAGFVRGAGLPTEELAEITDTLIGPYGAVAAYRNSALDEVGLLDENIFMYGEELDLAFRLDSAGWHTIAEPKAQAVHVGGASVGLGSSRQRERAGFGRGYTLRAYGALRRRHSLRTLVTELIVCVADGVLNKDLAAIRGRVRGWRAGASAPAKPSVIPHLDTRITFSKSLYYRRARTSS